MTEAVGTGDDKVYIILDEIRKDLSLVRTDVAVLAAAQPRIMDIVEDHERRMRILEVLATAAEATRAKVDLLEARLDDAHNQITAVRSEMDKNSWLPRISWSLLIAVTSIVVGYAMSTYLAGLSV